MLVKCAVTLILMNFRKKYVLFCMIWWTCSNLHLDCDCHGCFCRVVRYYAYRPFSVACNAVPFSSTISVLSAASLVCVHSIWLVCSLSLKFAGDTCLVEALEPPKSNCTLDECKAEITGLTRVLLGEYRRKQNMHPIFQHNTNPEHTYISPHHCVVDRDSQFHM